jgi:hypothetical protein
VGLVSTVDHRFLIDLAARLNSIDDFFFDKNVIKLNNVSENDKIKVLLEIVIFMIDI